MPRELPPYVTDEELDALGDTHPGVMRAGRHRESLAEEEMDAIPEEELTQDDAEVLLDRPVPAAAAGFVNPHAKSEEQPQKKVHAPANTPSLVAGP